MKQLTNNEFIEKCKVKYNDLYDYSKTVFNGYDNDIIVIDPVYGEFTVNAYNHLVGLGHEKRLWKHPKETLDEIIKKSGKEFPNLSFDDSKYYAKKYKICVKCTNKDKNGDEHGYFNITVENLLRQGTVCPKCYKEYCSKKTTLPNETFDNDLKENYGGKYERIGKYEHNRRNLLIFCHNTDSEGNEHGLFITKPGYLRKKQCCCKKCQEGIKEEKRLTFEKEFLEKAQKVHNGKYDYSKVKYVTNNTPVCIICPTHGEFWQSPSDHVNHKRGCPKCVGRNKTNEDFINQATQIHGNKYDYSKVEYKKWDEPVCIICPEHGEFWQTPNKHLNGHGCWECRESKLEKEVQVLLEKENIAFEKQKQFKWLKYKKQQSLDFYLPDHNIAIECQGEQHFNEIKHFSAVTLEGRIILDENKYDLCKKHGIKIIYYTKFKNKCNNEKYTYVFNKEELIKEIEAIEI